MSLALMLMGPLAPLRKGGSKHNLALAAVLFDACDLKLGPPRLHASVSPPVPKGGGRRVTASVEGAEPVPQRWR